MMMRAIRVSQAGGTEVLVLKTCPIPDVLPKTVLIRVRAIGINPVETYIRSGNYARMPPFPYTPGNDASGIVTNVGVGVSNVNVGDRVYTTKSLTGAYAEYTLAEAEHVRRVPDTLTFLQAAALPVPYYTAFRAIVTQGKACAGQTVLVHGATGGVGVACLQFAKAKGMTVIGTAGGAAGEAVIAPWCDQTLRHGAQASTRTHASGTGPSQAHAAGSLVDSVLQLTSGQGVDLIIEMRGDLNLGMDLKMIRQGGRVVVVGSRGDVSISPRDIMSKECIVTGVMLWHATHTDWAEAEVAIHAGCETSALHPIVAGGAVFHGLEQAGQAQEEVMSHARTAGAAGKVLIELNE